LFQHEKISGGDACVKNRRGMARGKMLVPMNASARSRGRKRIAGGDDAVCAMGLAL
jgi:hypothetical protein